MKFQALDQFRLPKGFRGRSAIVVQLWWLIETILFRPSPQFAYGFRRALLRAFGAQIGRGVLIRPTATVTYPWKLAIGDYSWIGDDVVLYTLGEIEIGAHSVVSQRTYVCAADHDYRRPEFPIRARKISVGSECWVATDVFLGPGVTIGDGTVVGARSTVTKSLPGGVVCLGTPCVPVRERESREIHGPDGESQAGGLTR